jgi:hypothetical protein
LILADGIARILADEIARRGSMITNRVGFQFSAGRRPRGRGDRRPCFVVRIWTERAQQVLALPRLDASGPEARTQNVVPADWQLRRLQRLVSGAWPARSEEVLAESLVSYGSDV